MKKKYSLRKCKKTLFHIYDLLKKKRKKLLPAQVKEIQNDLKALQEEILKENKEKAPALALKCEDYVRGILRKSLFEQVRDQIFNLGFALIVALVIRQMWFELYEIPTGSMRPTFKEKDRLIVSKTDFGINFPFQTKHFYFDEALVKRMGIVIFTAENMDIRDQDMRYFYLFPGKKQLVKRLIGKPGDTLYFYGGRIYGIDKEGKDISHELQLSQLEQIYHIPFIHFDGAITVSEPYQSPLGSAYRMAIVHQMNEAIARLTVLSDHHLEGEMLYTPQIHNKEAPAVKNYADLWGIKNFASARIVTKEMLKATALKQGVNLDGAEFFLELHHTPDLNHLELSKDLYGRMRPEFILGTAIIPLQKEHLEALFRHLYTARFVVKNGFAMRYSAISSKMIGSHFLPRLQGVPDGIYEFYHGKAYSIKWGGVAKELPKTHPLSTFSEERVVTLFNMGIDFDQRLAKAMHFETSRFAYFREGDLCLLGAAIYTKTDPILIDFLERETRRASEPSGKKNYHPFIDHGPPPRAEGRLDKKFMKEFGLLVPEGMHLVLGDNFAMSSDSRDFGFVPSNNLRGGPSFIFWPFGERFGLPNQPSYAWMTIPNLVVWGLVLMGFFFWYFVYKKHHMLPLKFDKER